MRAWSEYILCFCVSVGRSITVQCDVLQEALFDSAFAVAEKLRFDRLEFIAFLEDMKNQTTPPDPLNVDEPGYEKDLFRQVFSEYDEALMAEYEVVESNLFPTIRPKSGLYLSRAEWYKRGVDICEGGSISYPGALGA